MRSTLFKTLLTNVSETCFPISFRCQSGSLQLNSQTARMLPSLLIKYDSKIIMVNGQGKCKELVSSVVTLDVGL